MKEQFSTLRARWKEYWSAKTKKQQVILISGLLAIILFFFLLLFFTMRTNYVTLYSDLPAAEAGQIKESLDAKGVKSEITNDGTSISVPKEQADALKVELASEGIPESGAIDYTFIEDQMGFGMTDNEFSVMERAAMQTELQGLIQNINGVEAASVMITLPEESTWLADEAGTATASIVVEMGTATLEESEVKALYHLVSKSVPNLPVENVVIMNQNSEQFDYDSGGSGGTMSAFAEQNEIQKQIEKDLQQQLHQMLGTMMGNDKVVVSVTTDIDFTQENREEALVEPVDEENMEGLEVSAERITETFEGADLEEGGVVGAGEEDIANYPAGAFGAAGDSERTEERINTEVNRIHKEIAESPYKIRDLGIQVMVEPPDPEDPNSLPAQSIADIEDILTTAVSTSIDEEYLNEENAGDIEDKIFVSSQAFNGKAEIEEAGNGLPWWVYVVGGVLAAAVVVLVIILVRRRKAEEEEDIDELEAAAVPEAGLPIEEPQESPEKVKRKQLETLAKENPDEFTKLLRTWLSDD